MTILLQISNFLDMNIKFNVEKLELQTSPILKMEFYLNIQQFFI